MAFEAVARHLDVVRRLFVSLQGAECFSHASATQAGALKEMLRSAKLSLEDTSQLSTVLMNIPWADVDRSSLLSFVSKVFAPAASQSLGVLTVRHKLQSYEAFTNYLPSSLWTSMQQERGVALEKLVAHVVALGLRNPPSGLVKRSLRSYCSPQRAKQRLGRCNP